MEDEARTSVFEVRDLSVSLGGREVLKNQHLSAHAGEIIAIMGPSGCGKTTLLRTIARLQPATSGSLRFEQRWYSLTEAGVAEPDAAFHPCVTYVPQTLALWPHFTNYQNAAFALDGASAAASSITALAQRLNVDSVLMISPARCSHGQRQRIALIRALVLKPRLLLLDEVTSALDRGNSERVAQLLREFAAQGGTVLAVTHDLRFAQLSATRMFEMDLSGNLVVTRGES